MKTILYATDYSQNSISALKLSHFIAKKFDAMLLLLHVFDTPLSLANPLSMSYSKREKKDSSEHHEMLNAFCREHLADDLQQVDNHIMVHKNASSWSGILEKALKFNADMIVIGTRGTSLVMDLLLGSTTKALIRKSACAVLAVPPTFDTINFSTIAYASDYEQADIFAINKLVKIAQKFNAQIRVVHINTKKEYAGDQQMQWFKEMVKQKVGYKKIDFSLILSDSIIEGLNSFLQDSGAELLAVLERGDKGLLGRLYHKDTVMKIEQQINIPLLSYNVGGL